MKPSLARQGINPLLLAALVAFAPAAVSAPDISCRVVAISDGDTLTCLTAEKHQVKVRMAEIDTPEKAQPYGTRSRQALSDLAFGKDATLEVQDRDRYGRTVAKVIVDGRDVNREMVGIGAAWVYRDYLRDRSLLRVEAEARQAGRGLWALPEAERLPPWEWRRAARDQRQQNSSSLPTKPALAAVAEPAGAGFSCAVRKTCGQMASCAEAQFHLAQCGNGRLDGDGDGVPCEALCQ